MSGSYKIIDESGWKRALHCSIFKDSLEPCYCVSFELDITDFLPRVKARGYSFTMALIYTITKCADEIEEFRYRFMDGKVVLYERINTSFTYINEDTELFKVIRVDMRDTMEEYVREATRTAREQKEYFTGPPQGDVYQFSPLPWISFTHISHTISGKRDSAVPLFDWGKYFIRDGHTVLPFSVQVHHSFVDGIHLGKLARLLQDALNADI
ncbi:MAG: CatA-like O-acetyltransferase [Eubacteriales bacterium]